MKHDFVYALSPFGILLIRRHKARADSLVTRLPILSAVFSAINAASRDRNPHSIFVRRIRQDSMQAKAAATRHPLRSVRMIEQASFQRPRRPGVRRLEQRCRLDAAVERVRVMRIVDDLPDLFERNVRAFRKLYVVACGIAPGLAKIIRRTQERSPIRTIHGGPQPLPAVASVVTKSVNA